MTKEVFSQTHVGRNAAIPLTNLKVTEKIRKFASLLDNKIWDN